MTTILLSTDNSLELLGFRMIIKKENELKVVGETSKALPSVKIMIEKLLPDILIWDFDPAERNGVESCREICKCSVNTGTILVTAHELDYFVIEALRAGIKAHVIKESVTSELPRAIRSIISGYRYLSIQTTAKAVDYYINNCLFNAKYSAGILTRREVEIFNLLGQNYDNKSISEKLSMKIRTVETHHYNIYRKLGVKSKAQFNEYVLNHGICQVFEGSNSTLSKDGVK